MTAKMINTVKVEIWHYQNDNFLAAVERFIHRDDFTLTGIIKDAVVNDTPGHLIVLEYHIVASGRAVKHTIHTLQILQGLYGKRLHNTLFTKAVLEDDL